ncbi:MAG: response regulator transcription factor [Verrucomicrobiaceae bacterium]|nr:MAG: response regulator transcription factor [Verrucomicrobiaceae bacterium]
MNRIRILLVDDQALFREGLRTLLSLDETIEIVGESSNGAEAVESVRVFCPDLILMDLRMPLMGGVEATRRIRDMHPECRVLVLTTFHEDEEVFDALRAGACGYLLKDTPSGKLVEAIHAAVRGESVIDPSVAVKVVAEFNRLSSLRSVETSSPSAQLSARELDVLRLVARGRTNKEIASALHVTEGTVKNHLTNIFVRLGVLDRTQAALKAREFGIV